MKLSAKFTDNDTKQDTLDLSAVAKAGKRLDNIRQELENKISESYNRITHYQIGYEAQAQKLQMKWNKLSQNQQSLSSLMRQLKQVQSIWKLQLKINLKINKLSKIFWIQFSPHVHRIRTQTITNPILICLTSVRK